MKQFQGHYGLNFVLASGPEEIETAVKKLERHPNRSLDKERKISISDQERKELQVLQREKAKIRQRNADRQRQRYFK